MVLSDKKGGQATETQKLVVRQVQDPRSGDWLEPDLAHRRGLLDTERVVPTGKYHPNCEGRGYLLGKYHPISEGRGTYR